ncbi:MAG: class I SAM-dependent methyltransferase [Ruminococcaceae bacterium]|nr:class I SAM-dependent methyltransferase [Oscillospiraceae bacterium]
MSYNWIKAENYTMDTILLFDRWVIRYIMNENQWYNGGTRSYITDMAKALSRYPYVISFCQRKAPECTGFLNKVISVSVKDIGEDEARNAETSILSALETFVVYAYPEVMEQVNYIRNWNQQMLYNLVDINEKIVLDVGAGTGRLAFAAARRAKRVYASEPCDILREYMRDKIKNNNITNMKVLDGEAMNLPYEDNTFDVVMSGHVVGDFYDEEIAEMTRVTKNGGFIVCCNGDDEFKRKAPDNELVSRGFEFFRHESCEGGIIYDYRKMVQK